ncbi:MAG: chromosome segregation protein ScpA [Anaerolineales bacterium]|nr:chromosome segregation protein ScpA [Anaerolineae bacterium]PWB53091.1 MAG: chromosome segregation protein ScpA [Anaerolineales bacterium]
MFSQATQNVSNYSIATPVYEGPLDLLLQLIERAELDITKLSLALITDQYLDYIHQLTDLAADEVSAFLVIAAKLLQIKSEALLPRPPQRDPGEEDPGEALARQLIIYKRYREIAMILGEREAKGLHTYLRVAPPPKIEGSYDLTGITIEDVAAAAQEIFTNLSFPDALYSVVPPARVTIREKISLITDSLRHQKSVSFRSLVNHENSRLEIVVTFLAMLELIKRHLVRVSQDGLFGDISLEVSEAWDDLEEIEIEFGE